MKLKKMALTFFGVFTLSCFAYDGPIIDGHAHWGGSFNESVILERYVK
jgi:hypothetical protein